MAAVNLFPYSTVNSAGWTIIGAAPTIHAALAANTGLISGAETTQETRYIEIELDDLSGTGLNIGTITSIQARMEADIDERSQTSVLTCDYRDSSGSVINSYTEDISISTTGTNTAYVWTLRTTSDGSAAWTITDIDDMRLRFTLSTDSSSGNTEVFFIYLLVQYTERPKSLTINSPLTINGKLTIK